MISEYWRTLEPKIKAFWKPGQEIVCIEIFKSKGGWCDLCGEPISWVHSLINMETAEALNVGFNCLNSFQKVLQKLGLAEKFLLFNKYHRSVMVGGTKYDGLNMVVDLGEAIVAIGRLLLTNPDLKYKTLEPILKLTSDLGTESGDLVFKEALSIFARKQYYLIESSGLTEEEYNDPRKWREYCSRLGSEDEEFPGDYDSEDILCFNYDDKSPEGMGFDEIDWESTDFEEE